MEVIKAFETNNGVRVTIMFDPETKWKFVLRIMGKEAFDAILSCCETMAIPAMASLLSRESGPGREGGMLYLNDITHLSTLTLIGGITFIDEYVASPFDETELEKFYGVSVPKLLI